MDEIHENSDAESDEHIDEEKDRKAEEMWHDVSQ